MRARRYVIPIVLAVALAAADGITRAIRRGTPVETDAAVPGGPLPAVAARAPVPSFVATDLDGHDVSPATWRGRVVVVNFWATWCLPCRVEIPALAALQHRYGDRVLVLGLLQDRAADASVRAFATSLGVNYPIVRSTFAIEHSFGEVLALPTTYVVDREGRLVTTHTGQIDITVLTKEVEALLNGALSRVEAPESDRASPPATPGNFRRPG